MMGTLMCLYRSLKSLPTCLPDQPRFKLLQDIITVAYNLTQMSEFRAMLESFVLLSKHGIKPSDVIIKLGQYYRSTRQLVSAARRKRCRIFRRIRVQSFQTEVPHSTRVDAQLGSCIPLLRSVSNPPNRLRLLERFQESEAVADAALTRRLNSTRSGIKVHAEMKLMFFYEAFPEIRRPRVISTNKSSCYLCDLFFKLHGVFQVPSTFGMLNERWILPDWCKIPRSQVEHMRETLIRFDAILDSQLTKVLGGRERQPDPIQSLVALSATWADSQGARSAASVVSIIPPLPLVRNARLEAGESIWELLRGPELSFTIHFYKSYAFFSFDTANLEDRRSGMLWVRVSLESLQNYREQGQEKTEKDAVDLKVIREGTERSLKSKVSGFEIPIYIRWEQQIICISFSNRRL